MADNAVFYQAGSRILYSNTGDAITAGDVVPLSVGTSGYVAIAIVDIAATTGTGEVQLDGVWKLTKNAGEVFTQGQVVYWDDGNNEVTGTSTTTFYRCGRAMFAANSAATTCYVKLNEA